MSDQATATLSTGDSAAQPMLRNGNAGATTDKATNGTVTKTPPPKARKALETAALTPDPPPSRPAPGPEGSPPAPAGQKALRAATIVVGVWHVILAVATTVLTLRWWPLVEQAASSTVQSRGFTFTASSGVLLLAVAGGSAGSLVHTISIFSSRVGRRTFETTYLWWYLLRPIGAVLLALIFVAAVSSGLLSLSGGDGGSNAALSFIAGALAGLFTDAVLQKLRGLLGATSTEEDASTQAVPLAPPPKH